MNQVPDCIFCKIIKREIPAKIIAENELAIAFLDVNPTADGHTLIIPKNHHLDLGTCFKKDLTAVWDLTQDVARLIEASKLAPWGFNYLSNQGDIAGQVVKHFHVHVIPKYDKDHGFLFSQKNVQCQSIEETYDILFKKMKKHIK